MLCCLDTVLLGTTRASAGLHQCIGGPCVAENFIRQTSLDPVPPYWHPHPSTHSWYGHWLSSISVGLRFAPLDLKLPKGEDNEGPG